MPCYHLTIANKTGRWSKQEEKNLTDIVIRLNTAAGKDPLARDAPWESVVKEMGGTRTTMQCRKKWYVFMSAAQALVW